MLLAVTLSMLLSATPDDGFSSPPLIVADPVPAPAPPGAEAAPPLVSADVGFSAPPLVPVTADVSVTAPSAAPPAPGTFTIANPPLEDAPPAPVQPQPAYSQPAYSQPAYSQPAYSQPAAAVTAGAQREAKPDDVPAFSMRALGTASYALTTGTVDVGARAELDIFRLAFNLSYDQPLFSDVGTSGAQQFTGMVGIAPVATRNFRLRVLGGADVRLTDTAVALGPTFGLNGRAGIGFIAFDASALLTPLPFRRLEARAALVLKGGPVEFQGGYQVRLLDASNGGTLATMFSSLPEAGPYAAIGVSL